LPVINQTASSGSNTAPAARGRYAITFRANASCTDLPAVARSRTYTADLQAETPTVVLTDAVFGVFGSNNYSLPANVIYQRKHTSTVDWWFQDPEIWGLLDASTYVVIFGGPTSIPLVADGTAPQTGEFSTWARIKYCSQREAGRLPGVRGTRAHL
jgi:hypothetical protein